jgi:hypothetical protein
MDFQKIARTFPKKNLDHLFIIRCFPLSIRYQDEICNFEILQIKFLLVGFLGKLKIEGYCQYPKN